MSVPTTDILPPDPAGLRRAAALLASGALVAFPTETVYGLGADARNDEAVAAIYAAKGRPSFNPLIVHVASVEAAQRYVQFDDAAHDLAQAFWPGPMTLVLPLRIDAGISNLVTAGLPTLAIRVPQNALALDLLTLFDGPVAAPSANPSGRISPTTARHVVDGLSGKIAAVVDGGACSVGLESTIIRTKPDLQLLRPGGLPVEHIEAALGQTVRGAAIISETPDAPGQLLSHYAPNAPVRLNATQAKPEEVLLGFGSSGGTLNLSVTGDLHEAAANLFSMLRLLDEKGASRIAVAPIPDHGLGRAINDRLARAAAPRE
jgi:L-threonylcarbamoyladenylate synthase